MSKRVAFAGVLLIGLAAMDSGGCAFIHYDKGAGPPADPAPQNPSVAAPASSRQSALASLASQVGGPGRGSLEVAVETGRSHVSRHGGEG